MNKKIRSVFLLFFLGLMALPGTTASIKLPNEKTCNVKTASNAPQTSIKNSIKRTISKSFKFIQKNKFFSLATFIILALGYRYRKNIIKWIKSKFKSNRVDPHAKCPICQFEAADFKQDEIDFTACCNQFICTECKEQLKKRPRYEQRCPFCREHYF